MKIINTLLWNSETIFTLLVWYPRLSCLIVPVCPVQNKEQSAAKNVVLCNFPFTTLPVLCENFWPPTGGHCLAALWCYLVIWQSATKRYSKTACAAYFWPPPPTPRGGSAHEHWDLSGFWPDLSQKSLFSAFRPLFFAAPTAHRSSTLVYGRIQRQCKQQCSFGDVWAVDTIWRK